MKCHCWHFITVKFLWSRYRPRTSAIGMPTFSSGAGRSNNAPIAFGGVAGDSLESLKAAKGTLGRVAQGAREDRNRSVLLPQRPFSESHAPLRQIGQRSEAGGCLEVWQSGRRGCLLPSSGQHYRNGTWKVSFTRGTTKAGVIDENGKPILDPARNLKTAEQGAATSVWCATSRQLNGIMGGVYCENCEHRPAGAQGA